MVFQLLLDGLAITKISIKLEKKKKNAIFIGSKSKLIITSKLNVAYMSIDFNKQPNVLKTITEIKFRLGSSFFNPIAKRVSIQHSN